MTHAPIPSARARELVAGAYDTHVHVAPDVMRRLVTMSRSHAGSLMLASPASS